MYIYLYIRVEIKYIHNTEPSGRMLPMVTFLEAAQDVALKSENFKFLR